ncbi:ATP-binding protein [Streptomyces goshikiensis]|uniref:ATP-binding protein n=1 Tax=Streptomyces goshikiensis TaxID=1942 RepID=UPI003650D844
MNTDTARREDPRTPGHLLVLGSGPQAEWEAALKRLAEASPLVLIDDTPATWQRPYAAATRVANALRPEQVEQAARWLAIKHTITAVLHFHPAYLRAAVAVRASLGLPGPTAGVLATTSLRHRTLDVLDHAGTPSSGGIHVDSFEQALEAAHTVGFPLVCKPAAPRRRYAARVVESAAELAEAFSAATAASWPGTGTVVEPRLDGIEATAYTLDSRLVAISHATFDPEAEPSLIPLEVVVDADDVCAAAIESTVARALEATGHRQGIAQIRLWITPTGPRVLSLTTHLTDPLVAKLIEQVTGIDLIAASGRHARGLPTEAEVTPLGAAAIRYVQGTAASRLTSTPATRSTITPYARLDRYNADSRTGPLPRRGHLLVSGTDFPQCIARLRNAVAQMQTLSATT